MNRRNLLKGTAAIGLVGFTPSILNSAAASVGQNRPKETKASLSPLALASMNAWLYGLALIENAKSRADVLQYVGPNEVYHQRDLVTWDWHDVTTPNNDTLYSRSWIDLRQGPVKVTVPAGGDRYVSVAFMDMYMNNFAILGTRTTGSDGGTFTLVGPSEPTDDPLAIRSPTPWVWSTLRVLVSGTEDLDAARLVQSEFAVEGSGASIPPAYPRRDAGWRDLFAGIQALIIENPPPIADTAIFQTMKPLGVGMMGGFDANRFTAAQASEIEAGIGAAIAKMRSPGQRGAVRNGWSYPKFTLGDFEQDYLYRALVAIAGLGALPIREAMYLRPVSDEGTANFDSNRTWRLTIPGDALPPVDAFWSVSMYEQTPENQYYFIQNPIDRYMISDRTPDLIRRSDGGVDIWMSREAPAAGMEVNWLPTPSERPFSLVFRGYLPQDELLYGHYTLPQLTPVG